jgi:hypothetical protein
MALTAGDGQDGQAEGAQGTRLGDEIYQPGACGGQGGEGGTQGPRPQVLLEGLRCAEALIRRLFLDDILALVDDKVDAVHEAMHVQCMQVFIRAMHGSGLGASSMASTRVWTNVPPVNNRSTVAAGFAEFSCLVQHFGFF